MSLTILYATAGGNAIDIALQLEDIARRLHLQVKVYDIDDYEPVATGLLTKGADIL